MATNTDNNTQDQDEQGDDATSPSSGTNNKMTVLQETCAYLEEAITDLERAIQKTKQHLADQASHIASLKTRLAELEAKQVAIEQIGHDIRDRLHAAIEQTRKTLGVK